MQKITPFLWFDHQAEEAARYYVSIFKRSKVGAIRRYGEAGPGPKGSVMSVEFRLEGQPFYALNGGPQFTFTPAISLLVDCKTQQEVNDLWRKLSKGGQQQQCGWLQDRYGLTWQIVPSGLGALIQDPRAMQAMLGMKKLDIGKLRKAVAKARP
jgi:predicted 3-demethylubiquinone-9 3-methyltransferase (glyoxalase superfamily)